MNCHERAETPAHGVAKRDILRAPPGRKTSSIACGAGRSFATGPADGAPHGLIFNTAGALTPMVRPPARYEFRPPPEIAVATPSPQ